VCFFIFVFISMQQRVQQGLEDGARLPSLDMEKLRGENNSLREEQQRLKKVCYLRMFTNPLLSVKTCFGLKSEKDNAAVRKLFFHGAAAVS